MELKKYIAEAFSKEYGYRVKIASDCGSEHMDIIEKCLEPNYRNRIKSKELLSILA